MHEIEVEDRPVDEVKWGRFRPQVSLDDPNKPITLPEGLEGRSHKVLISEDKGRLHPWQTPAGLEDPVIVSVAHGGVSGSVYHTKWDHGMRHNWSEEEFGERVSLPGWRFVERDQAEMFGLSECKTCRHNMAAERASEDGIVLRSVGDGRATLIVGGETHNLAIGQVIRNDGKVLTLSEETCEAMGIERPSEDG